MYLHPDGIARRIRWADSDDGRPDWKLVLDRVVQLAERRPKKLRETHPVVRNLLVDGLRAMESGLRQVADQGLSLGLEPAVLDHLRSHLLARADELAKLV